MLDTQESPLERILAEDLEDRKKRKDFYEKNNKELFDMMKETLDTQELTSKELDNKKGGDLSDKQLAELDAIKLPFPLKLRKTFGIGKGCSVKTLFFVARNNAIQNQERFIENCELRKQLTQTQKALDVAVEALVDTVKFNKARNSTCLLCGEQALHRVGCPVGIAEAALSAIKDANQHQNSKNNTVNAEMMPKGSIGGK